MLDDLPETGQQFLEPLITGCLLPFAQLTPQSTGSREVKGSGEEGEESPGEAGLVVQLSHAEGDDRLDVEVRIVRVAEVGQAVALVRQEGGVLISRDVVVEVQVVASDAKGQG